MKVIMRTEKNNYGREVQGLDLVATVQAIFPDAKAGPYNDIEHEHVKFTWLRENVGSYYTGRAIGLALTVNDPRNHHKVIRRVMLKNDELDETAIKAKHAELVAILGERTDVATAAAASREQREAEYKQVQATIPDNLWRISVKPGEWRTYSGGYEVSMQSLNADEAKAVIALLAAFDKDTKEA